MAHPTDDELEAMAARLEDGRVCSPAQNSCRNGYLMLEAAAMLRACKGRAVKPLEWKWYRDPKDTSEARTQIGTWTVWEINGCGYCYGPKDTSGRQCEGGLEAAKAAAQADYEARVLSALEPAPAHAEWNAALEAAVEIATDWTLGPEEVAPAIRSLKKGQAND